MASDGRPEPIGERGGIIGAIIHPDQRTEIERGRETQVAAHAYMEGLNDLLDAEFDLGRTEGEDVLAPTPERKAAFDLAQRNMTALHHNLAVAADIPAPPGLDEEGEDDVETLMHFSGGWLACEEYVGGLLDSEDIEIRGCRRVIEVMRENAAQGFSAESSAREMAAAVLAAFREEFETLYEGPPVARNGAS